MSYEKIGELVSKSESHLLKVSPGEIADCWQDKIYKNGPNSSQTHLFAIRGRQKEALGPGWKGPYEKYPNKTREYMKNFDKFGSFTNKNKIYHFHASHYD